MKYNRISMDQFCVNFMNSQDAQIDQFFKVLEECKKKFSLQDQDLMRKIENFNSVSEEVGKIQQEKNEELERTMRTIDEYALIVERMEKVVDKAGNDLEALEEYLGINQAKASTSYSPQSFSFSRFKPTNFPFI